MSILRKYLCPLLAGVLTFIVLFSGCAKNDAENSDVDYLQLIGNTKQEVFEKANLTDNDVEYNENQHYYKTKYTKRFLNRDFSEYLLFDNKSDMLGGYRYELNIESPKNSDYKYAYNLLMDLIKEYGEPDTFPGLHKKIANFDDFKEVVEEKKSSFYEQWFLPGDKKIALVYKLMYSEDMPMRIVVQYAIDTVSSRPEDFKK